MKSSAFHYLFGPVPSRRLGRSLGIDLIPMKTCSMNCVFCQLGSCEQTTLERREQVPLKAVFAELRQWQARRIPADFATLSGSGEPTLHTGFGEVLKFARGTTGLQTALLSNGSLFYLPEVRKAAAEADVVKLSLSAWDASSFEAINRPAPGLDFEKMVTGQQQFGSEFAGQLWLEIFLIPGLNTAPEALEKIARLTARIAPDRIHLNTAVRPAAEPGIQPLDAAKLREIATFFGPKAEVIAESTKAPPQAEHSPQSALDPETLIRMVERHPATAGQLAAISGQPLEKVQAALNQAGARLVPSEQDVVEQCQTFLQSKLDSGEFSLPRGVSYTFAGSYENQLRATKTLSLILPLALLVIFMIIYFQFKKVATTLLVFSGVFVAWSGGFILIWLYGQPWFLDFSVFGVEMRNLFQIHTINLSVAVWVGFLALFGIATDDGVVMSTYLEQVFRERKPKTRDEIHEAVLVAAGQRVRPCLMTSATTILALIPVLTSTGRGSDVMVPMAIPSFGGMLVVLISIFVVPLLYSAIEEQKLKRSAT
jgi:wyosine [tRNA(Phe)-imidazoG37] synthetase (radical SAM superfamily)/preprotein translocase subunit SecF